MPLWQIYHPAGTFSDRATKQALVRDITVIYTDLGFPPFYVNVQFVPLGAEDFWISSETRDSAKGHKPFIRVVITHIHVNLPDDDTAYTNVTNKIDNALRPHIADKGYDWEYHVAETERRLWKVNGLYAPPFKSEDEKVWRAANYPIPPEDIEKVRKEHNL